MTHLELHRIKNRKKRYGQRSKNNQSKSPPTFGSHKPKYNDQMSTHKRDSWSKSKSKYKDFSLKKSKDEKHQKKIKELYSGGSEKFYNTLKEKLFEILGGKICSSCGFRDERALGFRHIHEETFDNIRRGGFASSWGKFISDPDLARSELKVLCLNCNEIRKSISPTPKKVENYENKKRFPR